MENGLGVGLRDAQIPGGRGKGRRGTGGEMFSDRLESFGGELLRQRVERTLENGQRPLPLEVVVEIVLGGRRSRVFRFGAREVEGERSLPASAFFRPRALGFVDQVVAQRRQKEGAKAALFLRDVLEEFPFQECREETLREVLKD